MRILFIVLLILLPVFAFANEIQSGPPACQGVYNAPNCTTVEVAGGTAAAPGIQLNNGSDTALKGIYGGNDSLGFSVKGTNAGVIDSSARLVWGYTAEQTIGGSNFSSEVVGINGTNPGGMGVEYFSNGSTNTAARFWGSRSRGTGPGNFSALSNGDIIWDALGVGDDGTQFTNAARISMLASGTVASTSMPSAMIFYTSTTATPSVLTDALHIRNDQSLWVAANTKEIADASGDLFGVGLTVTGTTKLGTVATATGSFLCGGASNTNITLEATTCVASDASVKHDIETIRDWNLLYELLTKRGVRFTYNEGKGPEGRQIGTIANDWDKDFPELISRDPDGTRHFNYQGAFGILLAANQQLTLIVIILGIWSLILSAAVIVLYRRK